MPRRNRNGDQGNATTPQHQVNTKSPKKKAQKKEAPVRNGGVMTGNTALVPNLLAMAFRFRQRKVPSGTSIYHTRTPSQPQNQNSQSRRISTSRAVGLAPAIPSTPAKWGWSECRNAAANRHQEADSPSPTAADAGAASTSPQDMGRRFTQRRRTHQAPDAAHPSPCHIAVLPDRETDRDNLPHHTAKSTANREKSRAMPKKKGSKDILS